MTPTAVVRFFEPYEFSPTVALLSAGFLWLFVRGQRQLSREQRALGHWRSTGFVVGVFLMYCALQTRFDFYSQHMFFIHRIQHLVLHHLGPLLIALSAPQAAIMAGLPQRLALGIKHPFPGSNIMQSIYRFIQKPATAGFIFVALIYLWLYPGIHFYAMLNVPLYNAMNWSMAIDGLLFWWMIFNLDRKGASATAYFGSRILVLFLIMPPQILIGSYIALSHSDIFSVYEVCGRIWPISAQVDQQLGGLITWIPASMMSALGGVIVLARWMHRDERGLPQKNEPAPVSV